MWGGQALRGKCLLLHFAQHLKEFTTSESCSSCLTGTPGSNTGLEVDSNLHENSDILQVAINQN